MVFNKGKGFITGDKFGFILYKFKLEMLSVIKDLWEIVEGTEVPPPSTTSDKVNKKYKRRCNKAFAIIVTIFVENDLEDVLQHS